MTKIEIKNIYTSILRPESTKREFSIAHLRPEDVFNNVHLPYREDGYNISVLLKGRLAEIIDFEKHEITGPAIISMGPGQIRQYIEIEEPEIFSISFTRDFLMAEIQGWIACWECSFGHLVMEISNDDLLELQPYVALMMREFSLNKARKEVILRNILQAFIISVARLKSKHIPVMQIDNQQSKLVYQFKLHVDEHFRTRTQVSQYAELQFITPGHLNDVIKAIVGKTAKQVINDKRITEAKRLLFFGDHSIKEISGLLNFDDDAYFNRFFKKHTGHTPSEFQRMIREKYN